MFSGKRSNDFSYSWKSPQVPTAESFPLLKRVPHSAATVSTENNGIRSWIFSLHDLWLWSKNAEGSKIIIDSAINLEVRRADRVTGIHAFLPLLMVQGAPVALRC